MLGPGVRPRGEMHTEMGVPLAKVANLAHILVTPGGPPACSTARPHLATPAYQVLRASATRRVTPETSWRVGARGCGRTPRRTRRSMRRSDAATVRPTTPACSRDGVPVPRMHQSCINHLLRQHRKTTPSVRAEVVSQAGGRAGPLPEPNTRRGRRAPPTRGPARSADRRAAVAPLRRRQALCQRTGRVPLCREIDATNWPEQAIRPRWSSVVGATAPAVAPTPRPVRYAPPDVALTCLGCSPCCVAPVVPEVSGSHRPRRRANWPSL